MKYLSLSTIENAFKGCKGKTQNKFWGLLAILNVIDKEITSGIGYSFHSSEVSSILDDLFNLKESSNDNRRGDTWSVLFSKKWMELIPDVMFDKTPNIYDVASWYFRKRLFADDFDAAKLLSLFLETFHFSLDNAKSLFDMQTKEIEFTPYLYSNDDLFSRIKGDDDIPNDAKCISFENSRYLRSYAGNLGQASFVQTLYSAQGPQKCLILTQFDFNEEYKKESNTPMDKEIQQIFYGAPGTGKSKTIKDQTEQAEKDNRVFRTTFHPDSDYSTFVGCYKPTMKVVPKTTLIGTKVVEVENGTPEEKIVYRFTPQAFTNAYVKAWNTEEDVFLIIEEINRGNCAQIFGDLFQLLDRGDDGKSEYPIDADTDLGNYIAKELESSTRSDFPDGVKDGKKLVLPSNLYIWATMNTSDQSLFPIDSAFKRRWDWQYMPIENAGKGWKIKVNGNEYDWYQFLEAINKEVLNLTHSEDKQMGYFFAKAKGTTIDAEILVNKVYFYLWTDVFKDYDFESQKAFRKPNSNEPIAFKNFFEDLMEDEKVNERVAEQVLINLELEKTNKQEGLFE